MKNSLGKLLLILMSLLGLKAEDFTYHFNLSNASPYVKEAVILTLDINQINKEKILFFHLNPQKSPDYELYRFNVKKKGGYHAAKVLYEYLIYPLHSGEIKLRFNLIQKATTDENLAYSFSGDRDNVKGLSTVDTEIELTPQSLEVKPLPKDTLLVGDFSLEYSLKRHKAKTFEPLPMQVILKGIGYPPLLENIYPPELNVTRFKEPAIIQTIHGSHGSSNTVTYPLAFSHDQNFTLPAQTFKAFNPKTKKVYTLRIDAQTFEISKVDVNTLVDKIDSPKPFSTDWSWLINILGYLVVFASGYLTATSLRWNKRSSYKAHTHPHKEMIASAKDEKALLQVLISLDAKQYTSTIEMLEDSLYGHDKIDLKALKKKLEESL